MNPATIIAMLFGSTQHSEADRHRRASWGVPVTLRLAEPADHPALERLAALDSSAVSRGPHLVAVRDGAIEAAISLRTHELHANPFRRTAECCELLRCSAGDVTVEADTASAPQPAQRPVLEERLAC
jgi:hypothetical protein